MPYDPAPGLCVSHLRRLVIMSACSIVRKSSNKGIEIGSNKLPLDIIHEACSPEIARVSTFLVSPALLNSVEKES